MSATTTPVASRLTTNRMVMDSMATSAANNIMTARTTCNNCYARLFELKRQAVKNMMVEYHKMSVGAGVPALDSLPHIVYQRLHLNEHHLTGTVNGICTYCGIHVDYIKKHALLQATNFAPFLSRSMVPQQQNNLQQHTEGVGMERPVASHGESSDSVNGIRVQGLNKTDTEQRRQGDEPPARSPASPIAAQFFAEYAKKMNMNVPSKKKSTKKSKKDDTDIFVTNFSRLIRKDPPENPPGLFKYVGRRVDGKVSVMLRIASNQNAEQTDSFISVDQRRKQVSIIQPKNTEAIPAKLLNGSNAPKLYAFDGIFESDLPQTRISSSAVLDVLHAVINGGEGCLLVYGGYGTGKTSTMVGKDNSNKELGVMPSAITWLYSLIEDSKQINHARISVRVSAVEVVGTNENLRDLLSEQASGGDSTDSSGASPGIYLREDPIGGTVQLGNVSEPQSASAEKAAFLLDAALASRSTETDSCGNTQRSHMIFTIHVYQYRVERNHRRGAGGTAPYSGGRSRLHLIDLSYVNPNFENAKMGSAPSHAGLGQIIVAMLNGFKQVPYRDSKITRLLKDSIGNLTCRSTLIAHVSDDEKNYAKTCATLQVTSKINRNRRKRNKHCSSSSDNSCDESGRRRRPFPAIIQTCGIDDNCVSSDYNTSSAGEDSCDTVIYNGNGHMSDQDLTDNERPPSPETFRAMKLKLASSSEDETVDPLPVFESEKMDPGKCIIQKMVQEPKKIKLPKLVEIDADSEKVRKNAENSSVHENVSTEKTKCEITPQFQKTIGEKAVNVVAPLVIKQENSTSDSNRTTSPSTDGTKTSLVNQLIESRMTSDDVILLPQSNSNEDLTQKIPSEKELRKREKRIAKFLKESLSGDSLNSLTNKNKKNLAKKSDGYASDIGKDITKSFEMTKKNDGYISAPEYNYCKPVQVVRGTIRQKSVEESLKELDLKDHVVYKLLDSLKQCDDIGTSVDAPDSSVDSVLKLEAREAVKSDPGHDQDFIKSKVNDWKKYLPESCVDGPETNLDACDHLDDCNVHDPGSPKIKDLNHIITVSAVPNFSVTKRPPLSNFVSSPKTRQNTSRATNATNLDTDPTRGSYAPLTPQFERSYSREDTCSLVSVNESEYDSDAHSSYTASPAVCRRQKQPTRLRYRWSTVYEEDESKKEQKNEKGSAGKGKKKENAVVLDSEAKPARFISSPKKSSGKSSKNEKKVTSPKVEKKIVSPKSSKKSLKESLNDPLSPKTRKKFGFLSPKSERKQLPSNNDKHMTSNIATDKRMSGCSDVSSGIGSTSSQTPSLHSNDDIHIANIPAEKMTHGRLKLWPFSRRSRKSRSSSGYMSDGNLTDSSSARSSRKYKFFSRSKSSLYTDGHSSGYDTSVTEGGMTSCAEDMTDTESISGKKKKRFLGFRRRSTNDLNSSRGRVKKPMWIDNRRCQSDDEGVQLKVYEIDGPRSMNRRKCKSEDVVTSRIQPRRIEELKKQREYLKSELHLALDKFAHIEHNAQLEKVKTHLHDSPVTDRKSASEIEKENGAIGKKLKVLRNHIQVVTCFDASTGRRVTQI